MPRRAWAFLITTYIAAALVILAAGMRAPSSVPPWLTFAALSLLGILAVYYRFDTPIHTILNVKTSVFFAGLFLLPLWMFDALVLVVLLTSWIGERLANTDAFKDWYIQPFNMSKDILSGAAAWIMVNRIGPGWQGLVTNEGLIAVTYAAILYTTTNQILLGLALWIVRGIPFNQSRVLNNIFAVEFPLSSLGFAVVLAWNLNPWLMLLLLSPLVLVYRAFQFPKLQSETVRIMEAKNNELAAANQSIQKQNRDLFETIARVFDARDPYTGKHAAQVAAYAAAIAKELNLPEEKVEMIRQAGYLHDIGKIAIPEAILNKSGKLTKAEYLAVQQHSMIGAELIESCDGLCHLAPFVREHHERWDGLGYPDGKRGTDITLEARILNICDSVETMATDRAYRKAMSIQEIITELVQCKGSQFDPILVDVFTQIIMREGRYLIVNSAREVESRLRPAFPRTSNPSNVDPVKKEEVSEPRTGAI